MVGLGSHGAAPVAMVTGLDLAGHVGDGVNTYGYLRGRMRGAGDPDGLRWDPFDDMVDDYLATSAAQQAAFMERLNVGFNGVAHVAWQVAQLHPVVGLAAAGHSMATGNFSVWDLFALVPGGSAGRAISSSVNALGASRAAYAATSAVSKGASKARIGVTGKIGEDALKLMGGESQKFFRTKTGQARYIDQFVNGVGHESKVGYTTLGQRTQKQIDADKALIADQKMNGSVWHFFVSPATGKGGPSQPLENALRAAGIQIVIH